jgi:hypothetical protein
MLRVVSTHRVVYLGDSHRNLLNGRTVVEEATHPVKQRVQRIDEGIKEHRTNVSNVSMNNAVMTMKIVIKSMIIMIFCITVSTFSLPEDIQPMISSISWMIQDLFSVLISILLESMSYTLTV